MLRRLKQRARDIGAIRALCLGAEAHARRDGQPEPGAEHFLLAALDLPDGTGGRAFGRVGADAAGLEAAIRDQYASALRRVGLDVSGGPAAQPDTLADRQHLYRAAPSGRSVMQELATVRKGGGRTPLVGAHVVAVIAGMPHGVAARALRAMGIDGDALRQAALDESGELKPR